MPTSIDRHKLQRLLADGAQLVEGDLIRGMVQSNQSTALVTTSEGRLVGLVKREEAERIPMA